VAGFHGSRVVSFLDDQVGPLPALGEAQAESSAAFDEPARDVGAVLPAESPEGPFSQLGHILDRMTVVVTEVFGELGDVPTKVVQVLRDHRTAD
jgi:hypothetical protein